jgi:serine protease Do
MKVKIGTFLATAVAVGFLAGGALTPGHGGADSPKPAPWTPEQKAAVESLQSFSQGFAAVAEAVIPSVVTITSEKVVRPTRSPMEPFANDPLFRRFFGNRQEPRPFTQHGLGSGVIVDPEGYILTNNHVISEADELSVLLADGRRIEATVVGSDPRTDLAVLKIDATDLPALTFGNSDRLRIGEWVMAVGSPFSENLQATVTSGIVSALGRSGMRLNEYENFIQTDAAINPGNSGGALVNLHGELVGINSAIASRTGGSNGIGFAIPANMARDVMDDLIHDGKVSRGWLGVTIQDVTPDLAAAMDLDAKDGVFISSVVADGPAAEAGLGAEDVIVGFNGKPVRDSNELRFAVAEADPGTRSEVEVVRDGRRRDFTVNLGEFPDNPEVAAATSSAPDQDLGISVEALTPQLARQYEIETARGLIVTDVAAGGPAEDAGIRPGDVIRRVNRMNVASVDDYGKALDATPQDKPVLFQVERGGNTFFIALRPESGK